ncbi:MAG: aminotransferase class V-fold PLP-dependent enzyme [Maricaulaceae bacterium]|jgi:selenocysteine lyase/cysteine desulfurase
MTDPASPKPPARPSRRDCLGAAATLPLAGAAACATAAPVSAPPADYAALPALEDFADIEGVYLNAGSVHPFSRGARAAVNDYLTSRSMSGAPEDYAIEEIEVEVRELYAQLINASTNEIAFIQSTSAGEQMAVRAVGLPEAGGRVVTDALHFFGSWHLYNELQDQGVEIVVLPMRDNAISMDDLEAAVNADTRLVSVSAVSTINGFEHDLKTVADIAHARGAKVYVDAVHATGAVPLDVRASGVDLMSSSSYKWLMGDMGLGFMFARADIIPELRRPQAGYYQVAAIQTHLYPHDPPGDTFAETRARDDAEGLFAMGTTAHTVAAHLRYSLGYIHRVGVERIQAYRQPLLDRVKREVPAINPTFEPLTPDDCRSSMVAFAYEDARQKLGGHFREAGVEVSFSRHRFRVSASVFNTMADIDRFLEVLSDAPRA